MALIKSKIGRVITLAGGVVFMAGVAAASELPGAATVKDEYDYIASAKCLCGGSYVPYGDFIQYDLEGDRILETILCRCEKCAEDKRFFFDLTPRYGKLSAFREAKLASRQNPAGAADAPCATAATAIVVNSITEEYIFLETTAHSCGTFYESAGQSLATEGGKYYDILAARCPKCGTTTPFYFDISSFYGDYEKYPEMVHKSYQRTPPAALPGRTPDSAFVGDDAERAKWLVEARHAADGGTLTVVKTRRYATEDGDYEIVETQCEKCGEALTLYLKVKK